MSKPIAAIRYVHDGLRTYIDTFGNGTAFAFGHRARGTQLQGAGGANRIILLPCDPSGDAGGIGWAPDDVGTRELGDDPDHPTGSVRAIANWNRRLIISCWAVDQDGAGDDGVGDLAQEAALEDLVELAMQALDSFGHRMVDTAKVTRSAVGRERAFGAEALIWLELRQPLFGRVLERAFPTPALVRAGIDDEP